MPNLKGDAVDKPAPRPSLKQCFRKEHHFENNMPLSGRAVCTGRMPISLVHNIAHSPLSL
jgi:hypothetical protein